MRLAPPAAVTLAALTLCACSEAGLECTEIGCVDGVEIVFDQGWPFPPGEYRYVVRAADGASFTCALAVSSMDENTTLSDFDCDPALNLALDVRATDRVAFILATPPLGAEVEVEVTRDGDTLIAARPELTYEEVQPNGPGCPPTCQRGATSVAVP